ncbi:MAG: MEDS domain-containing protein [Ilumatobacteraceae bacterium]
MESVITSDPRHARLREHLCFVFENEDAFANAADDFLAAGRALGEQTLKIARASIADLYADEADPAAQIDAYRRAVDRALNDGFSGLRVAADVTELVRDPEKRDVFVRYEHLIDRAMLDMPFSALCAYNRSILDSTVDEVVCMHPDSNTQGCGFAFSATRAGCALTGEVDIFNVDQFALALSRLPASARRQIDATDLEFIDHRGMLALDATGERVELRTCLSTAKGLAEILHLAFVDVTLVGR